MQCVQVPVVGDAALVARAAAANHAVWSLAGLRVRQVNSGGEVPADLLLFHVLFPFTLPHLHARCHPRSKPEQLLCNMW